MIELTEEMQRSINNARTNGNPCILATASPAFIHEAAPMESEWAGQAFPP